jgi:peptidoglycan/xylan/chitin deacetylase (PgdA/CDA1 family)
MVKGLLLFSFLLGLLAATNCIGAVPVAGAASAAAPATRPVVTPPRDNFQIYLLMGQSNMVGRDTSTLEAQVDNPRVLALNSDGKWVVAREPIHAQVGRIPGGMGPGIPFALEMLKADPGTTIGLMPCAVGGTPLSRWVKGGDLYEKAVSQAKAAAQSGALSGMLWHQGESDTTDEKNAQTYEARLTKMFKDLREDLKTPDLPIVVGQLGEFLTTEKYPYVETVRGTLRKMPEMVANTGFADAKGLGDKGDQLHFNAAGATEFGKRYAAAMQKLARASTAPATRGGAGGKPSASIAPFAGNRAAAISYTFDDNLRDQYTLALPMLKEAGFAGTFFIIPGRTAETPEEGAQKQRDPDARGKWGGISWPELKEMANQGHEIASHTWSHANMTNLTAAERDAELTKAIDAIKAHIGKPPLTLAFPGNASTPEAQAAALKHHIGYRSYQEATTERSTVATLNAWADKLVQDKKWGVMMTHALADGYAAMSDPEIFRTHLKHVKSIEGKIWVDTFANVLRYQRERENTRLETRATSSGVECTLACALDAAVYDVPLTIVIKAPGAARAAARRDGKPLPARVQDDTVLVEAAPGSGAVVVEWIAVPEPK